MKARAIQTSIGTRVYFDKYKFAADAITIDGIGQYQGVRVDCWPEEWVTLYANSLYELAVEIEKYCKKLKRQETKENKPKGL